MYSEMERDKVYLLKGRFAQQQQFEKAIQALFPVSKPCYSMQLADAFRNAEVETNVRKEARPR
jgi:hypothetical protein